MVENLQRQDLNSMEKALAVGQLKDQFALSVREIAQRLGISKSMVQRSVDILQLPDDLQAALISGASESKILILSQIKDKSIRKTLVGQLSELSRKELQEIVSKDIAQGKKVSHRGTCLLYTSPSPRDQRGSRMPSSA